MECASEAVCQRRDKEICYLGWILLFLWLLMVIYITKEIWFGAPLSSPSPSSRNSVSRDDVALKKWKKKKKKRRRKLTDSDAEANDVIELDVVRWKRGGACN